MPSAWRWPCTRDAVSEPGSGTTARFPALRILLAEDSPVNQKLALFLLEKEGHTVVVANDGREALAALETRPIRYRADGRPDAGNGRL